MMRSFLPRFPHSLIGAVLLIPCLLICPACATPFPIENLERGMTAETVLEKLARLEVIEPVPIYSSGTWPVHQRWQHLRRRLCSNSIEMGLLPLRVVH